MKRFVEWTFEGGPKSFISRVGADGNRTRYQSGVYDSTCERGPRVNLSGTAIIRTLLPSQEQQLRCPEAVFLTPGSKGLNPHELAHKWMKDLGARPYMSIKVGC